MKVFIPETFQFKSQDSDFSVTIPAEADAAKINPPFIIFRKKFEKKIASVGEKSTCLRLKAGKWPLQLNGALTLVVQQT